MRSLRLVRSSLALSRTQVAPARRWATAATATAAKPAAESPLNFASDQAATSSSKPTNGIDRSYSENAPIEPPASNGQANWTQSFHGLSDAPFAKEISDVLLAPLDPLDVEIKPDGIVYLPEIKYRRILNRAFGPGGWGMAPRGPASVTAKLVSREYALVCLGRLVSIARGEQDFFDPSGIPTAAEGAKSNALMRCCKDLGVASELWDPRFIRGFKGKHAVEVWATNQSTKAKKKLWRLRDSPAINQYPWQEAA